MGKFKEQRGELEGGDGLEIGLHRRVADDGKRFPAVDVLVGRLSAFSRRGEGVRGRGVGSRSRSIGGWRMTGSALTRWTLHVACDSLSEGSKGGWFGRGKGLAVLHNRRLADF